ncbi:hypothetical protein [Catenovulum maritimum]|uniref:Lipoprotein n=1 Tax=Catenovulum maritimum TaxID=1513271 RepID=A0A0J8GMF5_9ALTE|nr:hypothetical protein [Catenovulum maritimum]KMT63965.1 hypothetical protein XM47_16780 [Catenovulum maritimum]
MMSKFIKLALVTVLFGCITSCATVTETINDTKLAYQKVKNSTKEKLNTITSSKDKLSSEISENSLVRIFSDDASIIENREANFVKWNSGSRHRTDNIYRQYIKKHKLNIAVADLELAQKMEILKLYFYEMLKNQHIQQFKNKHKKVQFDEFLTDSENINAIYDYKMALAESEHNWNINLPGTQKRVAELMLASLFGQPRVKYLSYDPDDEEMYISVRATTNNFKEKIKFEVTKEQARKIRSNLRNLKTAVFFNFDNNALELVAVHFQFGKKTYLTDIVDQAYVRQTNVKFEPVTISLQDEDVRYTEVIKNLIPPNWFYNLSGSNIAYGQGRTKSLAEADANSFAAQSQKILVSGVSQLKQQKQGNHTSTQFEFSTQQKVQEVEVINRKIIKSEKKDGIWFVAVTYQIAK